MLFAYGSTRFVFFVGDVVVKIARPDMPLHYLRRSLYWRKRGEAVNRLETLQISLFDIIMRCLVGGIMANLEEDRFYRLNPKLPLAPTLYSFFGLVNVQVRGVVIREEELGLCPFQEHAQIFGEVANAENFARINGRICLIDYGFDKLNRLLGQTDVTKVALGNTMGARHL